MLFHEYNVQRLFPHVLVSSAKYIRKLITAKSHTLVATYTYIYAGNKTNSNADLEIAKLRKTVYYMI